MRNVNRSARYKYTHFKLWKVTAILSISFLAFSPSYADNLDVQVSGLIIDYESKKDNQLTSWCRGIGISYDIRNLSNRNGWSIAPVALAISATQEESLTSGFLSGILARWRYRFRIPIAFDVDLGGASCFIHEAYGIQNNNGSVSYEEKTDFYYFLPVVSIKLSYAFESGKLLGLQINAIYIQNIVPAFSLSFSVPIEAGKLSRYGNRRYR